MSINPTIRFSLFYLFCFTSITYAQKKVDLTIQIDSAIHVDSLISHFEDGLVLYPVQSDFSQGQLYIEKPFYAPFAVINFSYGNGGQIAFFIDERPTVISLNLERSIGDKTELRYSMKGHAVSLWDTVSNRILNRVRQESRDELTGVGKIYQNHGAELRTNDSVRHELQQIRKKLAIKTIDILKDYPDEYFAFFYFKNQIVQPDLYTFFKEDSEYFSVLLHAVKNNFSKDFTKTEEGKAIIQELEARINPIRLHDSAPQFTILDIHGESLTLDSLQGRYVLLDFWATWCGPCMHQMPEIKKLRDTFSNEQLLILGVSSDRDSTIFAETIQDLKFNWTHFLDVKKEMSRLFNIEAIPTLVLIDPRGKIIYRNSGTMDKQRIYDLIAGK